MPSISIVLVLLLIVGRYWPAIGWVTLDAVDTDEDLWGDGHIHSMSVYQDTLAVGTMGVRGDVFFKYGAAHIFTQRSGGWAFHTKLTSSRIKSNASCGMMISIHKNWILMGCPEEPLYGFQRVGAAYLFQRQNTKWVEVKIFESPYGSIYTNFASNGAINNQYLSIGAPYPSTQGVDAPGFLCNYIYRTASWEYLGCISPSTDENHQMFGYSIALTNYWLVVGAPKTFLENKPGTVYIFTFDRNWQQNQRLTGSSHSIVGELFGNSISMTDSLLAISAPYQKLDNGQTGAIYMHTLSSGYWLVQSLVEFKAIHNTLKNQYSICLSKHYMDVSIQQDSIISFSFNGEEWAETSTTTGYISIIDEDARFRFVKYYDFDASKDRISISHNPAEFTYSQLPSASQIPPSASQQQFVYRHIETASDDSTGTIFIALSLCAVVCVLVSCYHAARSDVNRDSTRTPGLQSNGINDEGDSML